MLNNTIKYLYGFVSKSFLSEPIELELSDIVKMGLLDGIVLNAGAGARDISQLVKGKLINQDIKWEDDSREHIDIFSPIHSIPFEDNYFDTILCIGVLEHVENPEDVIPEFFRVLKKGGVVVASVPFLQPEHKSPTDFQRYTKDGLSRLFSINGFEIVSIISTVNIYYTLHWIVYEWLNIRKTFINRILKFLLLPLIGLIGKKSNLHSDKIASAFRVIARK